MNRLNRFDKKTPIINFSPADYSSGGVLTKFCDKEFIYKTGTFRRPIFSKVEPVVEVICSEILDLMNIKHSKYHLVECKATETNLWNSQYVVCCKTRLFTTDSLELISGRNFTNNCKDYESIINYIGSEYKVDINNMIIFDYLVNNTDRHHRNFGILMNTDTGTREFSPLFDHGFSLCSDFDDSYLTEESLEDIYLDCDYSKFCCNCNKDQLRYVEDFSCNLNLKFEELEFIVDKYSMYLSPRRVEVIKYVLFNRLRYLTNRLNGGA